MSDDPVDVVEVARARISAILAHELSGLVQLQDLYLMKIDLKRGRSEAKDQSNELSPEIAAVRRLTDQMKGVISSIRTLQSSAEQLLSEECVGQLIQLQIDLYRIKFDRLHIVANFENHLGSKRFMICRAELLQVFTILLNNAVDAITSPDFRGFRMVGVVMNTDQHALSLSVFTPTSLDPKIKAQLQSGVVQGSTKELGWGLGLLVVQAVLRRLGGRLNIVQNDEGVTFETSWPLGYS
jgi:C4-dicarboxylate-specific signal transduction histidine kinase